MSFLHLLRTADRPSKYVTIEQGGRTALEVGAAVIVPVSVWSDAAGFAVLGAIALIYIVLIALGAREKRGADLFHPAVIAVLGAITAIWACVFALTTIFATPAKGVLAAALSIAYVKCATWMLDGAVGRPIHCTRNSSESDNTSGEAPDPNEPEGKAGRFWAGVRRHVWSTGAENRPKGPRGQIAFWTIASLAFGIVLGGLIMAYFAWRPLEAQKQLGEIPRFWSFGWTEKVDGDGWFNAARTAVTALGALGIGAAAYIAYRRQSAKEVERYDALDRDEADRLRDEADRDRDAEAKRQAVAAEARNKELDRRQVERALHDRTTVAADQLGHNNASIRTAGVYALGAIADEWFDAKIPSQSQAVVDILCAYLRSDTIAVFAEDGRTDESSTLNSLQARERDVRRTVFSMIRARRLRSPDQWGRLKLDLNGAPLSGENLSAADLYSANFQYADLSYTDLNATAISCANLSNANLRGASLLGSDLSLSDLTGADITDAVLYGTKMMAADFHNAIGAKRGQFNSDHLRRVRRPPKFEDDQPSDDESGG